MTSDFTGRYIDQARRAQATSGAPGFVASARALALQRFEALGFPQRRKNEAWKYTNVLPLVKVDFDDDVAYPTSDPTALERHARGLLWAKALVVTNGRVDRERVDSLKLPAGVRLERLRDAADAHADVLEAALSRFADQETNPFALLNTAAFHDALILRVAKGVALDEPLCVVHFSGSQRDPSIAHPRLLVVCDESSEATVIEAFVGHSEAPCLTNAVSEVFVGANATINHLHVQWEAPQTAHVSTTNAYVRRDGRYRQQLINLGGSLVRNNVRTLLQGENAECTLNGLSMVRGTQHVDNQTSIEHLVPNGNSWQLYKGVVSDQGTLVFNGRIFVEKDAQKTDAKQQNNNLLLNEGTTINSKPQLEIFADDVKCTHGATVGRLDAEGLFYLRARGIGEAEARNMLTHAFASEVIDACGVDDLAELLSETLRGWLNEG
ncbi:MAG: Fe-S cluster assembly protein SufD [Myxococcales bacterium]|nr:Fe-S cluster assembly protein SufD [Myxococcales bacterium]